MAHFTEALNLARYTLYMQDYGGPVGFRMALAHPGRVEALIVQNAVAHNEGLGVRWKTRREFWADRAAHETALRANLLSLEATRTRHVGTDPNPEKYDPDLWADEYAFLNKPGEADIQGDLFYDYRTNVDAYPTWQAWMQKTQPRLLVLWGKYDPSFELTEPGAYAVTFRRLRFTSLMRDTSPWIPPPTTSPISFAGSCRTGSMTTNFMMPDSAHLKDPDLLLRRDPDTRVSNGEPQRIGSVPRSTRPP